jgi:hypothetical protein
VAAAREAQLWQGRVRLQQGGRGQGAGRLQQVRAAPARSQLGAPTDPPACQQGRARRPRVASAPGSLPNPPLQPTPRHRPPPAARARASRSSRVA